MTFRNYLRDQVISYIQEGLLEEGRRTADNQPTLGGLIPVDGEGQVKSNFESDSPKMRSFANSSPENLAQVLIFVLITPRTNLTVVYQTMPIITAILKTKFDGEVSPKALEAEILKNTETGVTIRNAIYGYKIQAICNVWNHREEIFQHIKQYSTPGNENVVALMDYLAAFPGLDVVKAAFACQCVLGKLGCIDVHNHLIYTNYIKSLGLPKGVTTQKVNQLSLKNFAASGKKQGGRIEAIERYLKVLNMLEKEGFGTK